MTQLHLRALVRDLSAALALLLFLVAPAGAATFGNTAIGGTAGGGFSANVKRCTMFPLNETGSVSSIAVYTGATPGFSGSQTLRGVIYSMSGGSPLKLEATSNQTTVTSTQAMGWVTMNLPSAVALNPGTYCLGIHSGGTEGVADFRKSSVANSWWRSSDTYSDGASNLFGAPDGTGDIYMSIYANYAPTKTCTKYASPTGSDAAAGTSGAPYLTLGKLLSVLTTTQTGCLVPVNGSGTVVPYQQKVHMSVSNVTLKTDPRYSTRADIQGRISVDSGTTGDWIDNVKIDGNNASLGLETPVQVYGDAFKLTNSEVMTSDPAHSPNCIEMGYTGAGGGKATNFTIERNVIHACGAQPSGIGFIHGIYADWTDGGTIDNNYFYDNAGGYDIQLYTDADNLSIHHNTMDGSFAGITFAGDPSGGGRNGASDGNAFDHNIVTNTTGDYGIRYYWGGPVGTGNSVTNNCVFNNTNGNILSYTGETVSGTITADPLYVNRAGKDFRLSAGSPCSAEGVQPY